MIQDYLTDEVYSALAETNRAWTMHQIEAPLLTPKAAINPNYTNDDVWIQDGGELVLRPETTPGSYTAATQMLLNGVKPPLCVWQVGKSFRKEQHSQSYGHMRLDEFYQQEFQCIYTADSKNDYHAAICPKILDILSSILKTECRLVESDRLPDYSEITMDVEARTPFKWLEICSISRRKDFPIAFNNKELKVLEIALGLCRLVHVFTECNK